MMQILLRRFQDAPRALAAAAAAASAVQLSLVWISVHGSRPAACAIALGAAAVALLATSLLTHRIPTPDAAPRSDALLRGFVAAAVVAAAWLAPSLFTTAAEFAASVAPASVAEWASVAASAVFLAVILTLIGYWFDLSTTPVSAARFSDADRAADHRELRNGLRPATPHLLGAAAGTALVFLHAVVPLPIAITCSTLVVITLAAEFLLTDPIPERAPEDAGHERPPSRPSNRLDLPAAGTAAACGILLVAAIESLHRLFPGSAVMGLVTLILALAALHGLQAVTTRWPRLTLPVQVFGLLTLAALPLAFPLLIEVNLIYNAHAANGVWLIAARAIQGAAFCVAALVSLLPVSTRERTAAAQPRRLLLAAVAAGAGVAWLGIHLTASPLQLLVSGLTAAALSLLLRTTPSAPQTTPAWARPARALTATAALAIPLTAGLLGTVDSAESAQLLFSDRAVVAVRLGVDRDLIPHSAAMRLIDRVPAPSGELTLWRRNGFEFEFRRNGTLLGRATSDTQLCPQPAQDMLLAVLPLVFHPDPGNVLLLGDPTGTCLRSCAGFPVRRIHAVRPDEPSTELARATTWSTLQRPPQDDERVALTIGTAMTAVRRAGADPFDVIIADSSDSTQAAAAPEFTADFYRAARQRLTAGGVFCQRFRQPAFGAAPLERALATLRHCFPHAIAVQTVPGEVALLATDHPDGLFDDELLARLQRHHVRREIATAGWDWCQVAALPLLDSADPLGLFAERQLPTPVTSGNAWFLLSLPLEAGRSGDKRAEQRQTLAPHQTAIAECVPYSEHHKEMKRRISALAQQTEILCGMPDQPFTYRRSLRMELQQNPRPPVEVVRNGNVARSMHPLDKLRRDYFATLGQAIQQSAQRPSGSAAFDELAEFTTACEPLLSYFAHHELIRLHEQAGHPDADAELRHRMHVVYFAEQADASVRPVIAALDQINDTDQLIPHPADRFDHLNALLQKLIERWEARTAWEPRSALRVQHDVDASIHAVNQALLQMEALSADVGVPRQDFIRRRRYVNAALIAPLRDYREHVLAHRVKHEDPASDQPDDGSDLPLLIPPAGLNTN